MMPAEALPISHELSIQLNKPEMGQVNIHPLGNFRVMPTAINVVINLQHLVPWNAALLVCLKYLNTGFLFPFIGNNSSFFFWPHLEYCHRPGKEMDVFMCLCFNVLMN